MSESTNVHFIQENGEVVLYIHWNTELLNDVACALYKAKEGGKLREEGYSTRIVMFDLMSLENDPINGFGIYAEEAPTDGDYPPIFIDFTDGTVQFLPESDDVEPDWTTLTFEQFFQEMGLS